MSELRILIIEDDPPIRKVLRASLTAHGYETIEAESAREGLMHATTGNPNLIVLDLGLPDRDGMELIAEIRGWSQLPIIVLSARGQEQFKIAALDAGADDYLTKPFSAGELIARIRVALRHAAVATSGSPISEYRSGSLFVDLGKRLVTVSGKEVHLTPIEFKLLVWLIKHARRVVTHRQLLLEVWGPAAEHDTHYVRIYMGHLRQKIEAVPAQPKLLLNEPGVGYRLVAEEG